MGHGSHVSGIAAGNYGASSSEAPRGALLSGMAPRARIASYKVSHLVLVVWSVRGSCERCKFVCRKRSRDIAVQRMWCCCVYVFGCSFYICQLQEPCTGLRVTLPSLDFRPSTSRAGAPCRQYRPSVQSDRVFTPDFLQCSRCPRRLVGGRRE